MVIGNRRVLQLGTLQVNKYQFISKATFVIDFWGLKQVFLDAITFNSN